MKRTRILSLTAAALLVGALSATTTLAGSLEDMVVKFAKAPEQHQALAAYYRDEAAAARTEATRHKEMAAEYNIGNLRRKMEMAEHCAKLTAQYESLAKEYDALAAEHEREAGGK